MKLYNLIALICIVFGHFTYAEITPIHTFREAFPYLKNADPESLIIFDVDEVLIIPQDLLIRYGRDTDFTLKSGKAWADKTSEEKDEFISIMAAGTSFMLVDPTATSFLQYLQQQGFKAIALTALKTGQFGVIDSMADWRIKQLGDLNIDFGGFFPATLNPVKSNTDSLTLFFPELASLDGKSIPLFKQGILFLGNFFHPVKSNKGELLIAFLEKIHWNPKKIFFFDDKLKNLASVEEYLEKKQIPFLGFHFKGAELFIEPLNEEIAELQIRHLSEKREWLTDQKAKQCLETVSR